MAKIIGTSGAWGKILTTLAGFGLRANHPDELASLLEEQQKQLQQKIARAEKQTRQRLKPLEAQAAAERERIQQAPAGRLTELEKDLQASRLTLELYRSDAGTFGLVRSQQRARQEKKIQALEQEKSEISQRTQQLLKIQEQTLAEQRTKIEADVATLYSETNDRVAALQSILDSPLLAAARLELDMLAHLEALPENAWVLNHLDIETERPVRFEGKSFWQAQINHLVLTPAGLFTIQVWHNSQSAESDPYQQIRRAAYLCHELLKEDFPGLNVRAILAYRGHPPTQQNSAVKTLPIAEVNAYIAWFKENSLSQAQIARAASLLGQEE